MFLRPQSLLRYARPFTPVAVDYVNTINAYIAERESRHGIGRFLDRLKPTEVTVDLSKLAQLLGVEFPSVRMKLDPSAKSKLEMAKSKLGAEGQVDRNTAQAAYRHALLLQAAILKQHRYAHNVSIAQSLPPSRQSSWRCLSPPRSPTRKLL